MTMVSSSHPSTPCDNSTYFSHNLSQGNPLLDFMGVKEEVKFYGLKDPEGLFSYRFKSKRLGLLKKGSKYAPADNSNVNTENKVKLP